VKAGWNETATIMLCWAQDAHDTKVENFKEREGQKTGGGGGGGANYRPRSGGERTIAAIRSPVADQ